MFALTIRQPWCECIAAGYKAVENRSWRPADKYLGQTLALHSSGRMHIDDRKSFNELASTYSLPPLADLRLGMVIGTAFLEGLYRVDSKGVPTYVWPPNLNRRSKLREVFASKGFKDFYVPGQWGWVWTDVRRIEPIPAEGRLGIWELPDLATHEERP